MEHNFESSEVKTEITFTNELTFSSFEADKLRNEKKQFLFEHLKDFLSTNERFKGKEVSVTFTSKGYSSFVCVLETEGGKSVLKIPIVSQRKGEGDFLRAWESVGVLVPQVLEEGEFGEYPYILLSYVDAPTLKEVYGSREKLLDEGGYQEMGRILRKMHEAHGEGFGKLEDGKARYETFGEMLEGEPYTTKFQFLEEHNLWKEQYGTFEEILGTLRNFVGNGKESSYCHNDFDPANLFATEPFTVFDPGPAMNHPYVDLAMAIVSGVSFLGEKAADELKAGYFNEGEEINEEALFAAMALVSWIKFYRWQRIERFDRIKNTQDYFGKLKS